MKNNLWSVCRSFQSRGRVNCSFSHDVFHVQVEFYKGLVLSPLSPLLYTGDFTVASESLKGLKGN